MPSSIERIIFHCIQIYIYWIHTSHVMTISKAQCNCIYNVIHIFWQDVSAYTCSEIQNDIYSQRHAEKENVNEIFIFEIIYLNKLSKIIKKNWKLSAVQFVQNEIIRDEFQIKFVEPEVNKIKEKCFFCYDLSISMTSISIDMGIIIHWQREQSQCFRCTDMQFNMKYNFFYFLHIIALHACTHTQHIDSLSIQTKTKAINKHCFLVQK